MTHSDDLNRALKGYFEVEAAPPAPTWLMDRISRVTIGRRPRPAWWAGLRQRDVAVAGSTVLPAAAGLRALIAMLLVAAVVGAAILFAGHSGPTPNPTSSPTPSPASSPTATPTPTPSSGADRFRDHQAPLVLAGHLLTARSRPALVLLPNGDVLILGGADADHPAERFDPVTGTSRTTGTPAVRFAGAVAVPLLDGRVLVIGGKTQAPQSDEVVAAQVYDPGTDTFTQVGSMIETRAAPIVTRLNDGRVLALSPRTDQAAAAELFDPATSSFSTTGRVPTPRVDDFLITLNDGRVLLAAGCPIADNRCASSKTALTYDPETTQFSPTGSMFASQAPPLAPPVKLPDGRVLMLGSLRGTMRLGRHGVDSLPAEVYDPRTGTFSHEWRLPHAIQTGTLLPDGLVLLTGRWDVSAQPAEGGRPAVEAAQDRWIGVYDPQTGESRTSLDPITGVAGLVADTDSEYDGAIRLSDGRVLLLQTSSDVLEVFR